MAGLRQALLAARELGLKAVLHYAGYQVGLRSGLHRRSTPVFDWAERPLARWLTPGVPFEPAAYFEFRRRQTQKFFFPLDETPPALAEALHRSGPSVRGAADEILKGEFRLFGGEPRKLGVLPDWGSSAGLARSIHWSKIDQEVFDDIRITWEPARFAFVFPLARAHRLTGEAGYFEAFWRLLESWRQSWPANAGPHWISGQEVAIRLLGLGFAWYAFGGELSRHPHRAADLAATIAAHAARIPPTMSYARAQGNNHLLSEAAALYTTGLLFPELEGSGRWRKLGRDAFLRGVAEQVFPDGGYVQHSTRYHRLALDLAIWCARLAQIHGEPLPESTLERLARLTECLAALVDPATGQASNLGHNDGAHVLPLTDSAGGDFRPTLQSAGALFLGSRVYPTGPWDELAQWLGVDPAGQGGRPKKDSFPDAGLHFAHGVRSRGTLRCVRFRSRPSHSDQLQFDLWAHGVYLIRDPGTYRYKTANEWVEALAGVMGHNGPVLDGREPMERAGRFLWTRWAQGRLHGRWRSANGALEALTAEHSGYERFGVQVLRTVVRAGDEAWLIADDVVGKGVHSISCRWLLPDGKQEWAENKVIVELEGVRAALEAVGTGMKVGIYREGRLIDGQQVEGRPEALGWYSPTYDALVPGVTVAFGFEGSLPQRIETRIVLDGGQAPRIETPGQGATGLSMKGALVVWKNETLRLS